MFFPNKKYCRVFFGGLWTASPLPSVTAIPTIGGDSTGSTWDCACLEGMRGHRSNAYYRKAATNGYQPLRLRLRLLCFFWYTHRYDTWVDLQPPAVSTPSSIDELPVRCLVHRTLAGTEVAARLVDTPAERYRASFAFIYMVSAESQEHYKQVREGC